MKCKISQPFKMLLRDLTRCNYVTIACSSHRVGYWVELFFESKNICNKTFLNPEHSLKVSFLLSLYIVRFGDLICLITYIFLIWNKVSRIITNASNYTTLLLPTIYRKYSWKVARFFTLLDCYVFYSWI